MSDRDQTLGLETPDQHDELEEVLVVLPRRGNSRALVPALVLIVIALGFLVLRSSLSDWKGIETKPLVVETPAKVAPEQANPPAKPTSDKPDAAIPPQVAKIDPMAEINKEAERKQHEKDELERLKKNATDELARAPQHPEPPRFLSTPWQRRREAEAFARERHVMDQFLARARERHDRMFNEAIERHRQFQRQFEEGFAGHRPGMPFGGMEDFPRDFPFPAGRPQDFANRPGGGFHQQSGTFILPDGGQGEWNSTIIIQRFDDRLGN